jgi:DNA-binding transcriptional MerR regulator
MTAGALARATGVTVRALHHYGQIGRTEEQPAALERRRGT